ncbi:MntP/YtaF family protein [Paenibacillus aurantius]|uniref:MntP/YtaF family protein n=1 Tax=Paenibacillus aurantius TaxID=2918900 RepID=A0AA96LA70_9BACL|nr:MntP/YtaF family protein [Paenibacillus aurantius]WNQ09876.1 MntP/YtaF family protein [Paenibacillus aurantius]
MPALVSLFLLAFAVSLDGFGVGTMYGLRRIRIPLLSVAIISFFSGLVILLSMQIGVLMAAFLSPGLARSVGGVILVGIGIWAVYQSRTSETANPQAEEQGEEGEASFRTEEKTAARTGKSSQALLSIELKRWGIVIQILKTPSMADIDRSGIISPSEAALLGLALSLDAFGAGIGAALIGFPPLLTAAVIAFSSGAFITAGLRMGLRFAGKAWLHRFSILPGFILVLMGILKLF